MTQFNRTDNFLIPPGKQNVKAAVFIAHPDDETIWMGGTMLLYKDWTWKVFIATHTLDNDRGKEFQNVASKYKNEIGDLSFAFIEIMPDEQDREKINTNEALNKLAQIDLKPYDLIFTHNIDGEYKHPNHELLGNYFKEQTCNVWHFLCPAIKNPKEKQIGEYIETVYLDSKLLDLKNRLFQESYPTQQYYWADFSDFMRFQFCSGVEMFTHY